MSLVTIIWSVAAGAALVLGLVHALVWGHDRRATGNLAFGPQWGADSATQAQNHALSYYKNIGQSFVNEMRLSIRSIVRPTTSQRAAHFGLVGMVTCRPSKQSTPLFLSKSQFDARVLIRLVRNM